jgi:hypothetical protein
MRVSSASLVAILLSALDNVHAFAPAPLAKSSVAVRAVDEDSAQVLSEYMAKSHVEKLKAIKEVEAKKNAEIDVSKPLIHYLQIIIFQRIYLCLNQ